MLRTFLLAALVLTSVLQSARTQSADVNRFAGEFNKLLELKDEKALDKLLKSNNDMPAAALTYFQLTRFQVLGGKAELQIKLDTLKGMFARVFEKTPVLDKLERWCDMQDSASFSRFDKVQRNVNSAWNYYSQISAKTDTPRKQYEEAAAALMETAKQMELTGHKIEAAESWKLVGTCLYRMPDKTLQDRKDFAFAMQQYVDLRKSWEWTQDPYFVINQNTLKGALAEIEAKTKDEGKRKAEGYTADAKGVDALAMPNSKPALSEPTFALLEDPEVDLDYSQRGGPVKAMWWSVSFPKDAKDAKITGFHRCDLYAMRPEKNKFGVSSLASDPTRTNPVEVSNKVKASRFFIDADKKVPYGMFFWVGGDRERLGEAEVNLMPSDENTNIYLRSAASWTATCSGEQVTFYDDNTSGSPADGDPFVTPYLMPTLGFPVKDAEGKDNVRARAPLLDSMRIGKGPRVPFSEFAFVGGAWQWLHREDDPRTLTFKVAVRPLNPEYLKLGKVKLLWSGPKPTAPVQLVIAGRGDFKSACFDVASGKEIELPSGPYSVIYGRILQGKGDRMQTATIYGDFDKPFTVEPGKTFELKMGAPFTIACHSTANGNKVDIDGRHIWLREQSGCAISELHGMSVVPEVMAAKAADGKGAKVLGKFLRCTDPEFLNAAARKYADIALFLACMPVPEGSKDGNMVLQVTVPAGLKVGLAMKKHPLFGKLDPFEWR